MKYRDLFTADNGIFATVFNAEYPTEFAAIFGDTQPQKIDVYALFTFGQRTLAEAVTADTYKDIVSSVIAVNVDGWKREAEAMLAEYDVLNPTTQQTERTETITSEETGDSTDTGANKAFNDTEFSDSDKNTKQDEKSRTEERKTTEKTTGTGANKSISAEIQKEIALRRDKWRKSIIFALVNEITTSIYE